MSQEQAVIPESLGSIFYQISDLCELCGSIAKSKGFDTGQHGTQVALVATEVAEALEHLTLPENPVTAAFIKGLRMLVQEFETYRKEAEGYRDGSSVADREKLYEELADILIRVFSYAGGNGQGGLLATALLTKIEKNAARPYLHGKAF